MSTENRYENLATDVLLERLRVVANDRLTSTDDAEMLHAAAHRLGQLHHDTPSSARVSSPTPANCDADTTDGVVRQAARMIVADIGDAKDVAGGAEQYWEAFLRPFVDRAYDLGLVTASARVSSEGTSEPAKFVQVALQDETPSQYAAVFALDENGRIWCASKAREGWIELNPRAGSSLRGITP